MDKIEIDKERFKIYCATNKYKCTIKDDPYKPYIIITKKRSCKIILKRHYMIISYWNPERLCYTNSSTHNRYFANINWYDSHINTIDAALQKAPQYNKKTSDTFEVEPCGFIEKYISLYTNGLVKMEAQFTSVIVTGIVEFDKRGIIRDSKPDGGKKDCWFMIDGKHRCPSNCKGHAIRVLFNGEQWIPIRKTDKHFVIDKNTYNLYKLDRILLEEAVKLFMTCTSHFD
jgi:hypothetical protein